MHSDLFDKSSTRRKTIDVVQELETDDPEDHGAFGFLRGVRDKAIMLEIRHKDGRITANAYAWLESVEFDPSEGILLNFSGKVVKLTGRNLNAEIRPNVRLLAGLFRHRVPWIQEADGPTIIEASKESVVIESVKLE